ncbi:MAG: alpha/beta fold hydrolase [Myxococcales bacterium]|nr:alpha/beta fold hydrolase [Myxococcales bacterium]
MKKLTRWMGTIALATTMHCGAGPIAPQDGSADAANNEAGDASAPLPAVEWTPCSLETNNAPDGECATLRVPLDARNPTGETIEYFVKRYRPAGGRGLRALWMLQGGPGASGLVFEGLSEAIGTRFPDVDFYFPDHRGTGRSTRIECPEQEASTSPGGLEITAEEWPACLATARARWGDRLQHFSTTNAANDTALAMRATRRAGQSQFVLGISYGTYLAHRLLQIDPNIAQGVVLDSIAAPGLSLLRQDEDSNEAARDFLNVCAMDTFCRSKLGPDPWAKAQDLFRRLKMGHCAAAAIPAAPTHVLLRKLFASFLMQAENRAYIPAIIYRADRCEPRDVSALRIVLGHVAAPQPASEELRRWGWVLTHNVALSEFNERPEPTAAVLEAIRENAVASRDVTALFQVHLGRWPTYTDTLSEQWATTTTPMLMLSGGLDPATLQRKSRLFRPHFTGANQHWVEIPTAGHTTFASSPFVDESGERRSCGMRMIMSFIENPTAPLDQSCVSRIEPVDFRIMRPDFTRALLGTTDPWE